MPNTIYLIEGYEYDDQHKYGICTCSSKEKAEDMVDKLTELDNFNKNFIDKVREEFEKPFDREVAKNATLLQPTKPPAPAAMRELAQARVGQRHTGGAFAREQKAKFKELEAEHFRNLDAYRKELEIWKKSQDDLYNAKKQARDAFFAQHYLVPKHLKQAVPYIELDRKYFYSYNVHHYSYRKIDLHWF